MPRRLGRGRRTELGVIYVAAPDLVRGRAGQVLHEAPGVDPGNFRLGLGILALRFGIPGQPRPKQARYRTCRGLRSDLQKDC